MFPTIASALAALFYCLSAILIFKQLGSAQHQRWIALTPALLAVMLQAVALNTLIIQPDGLNLGFFASFSLIAWLISIQILLSSLYRRIESLGIVVFPLSGLSGPLMAPIKLVARPTSTPSICGPPPPPMSRLSAARLIPPLDPGP